MAKLQRPCRASAERKLKTTGSRPWLELYRRSAANTNTRCTRKNPFFLCFLCSVLCFLCSVPDSFAQSQLSWKFAGPLEAPDRVSALAVDPRDDTVLYLAAPGGGVWKTGK